MAILVSSPGMRMRAPPHHTTRALGTRGPRATHKSTACHDRRSNGPPPLTSSAFASRSSVPQSGRWFTPRLFPSYSVAFIITSLSFPSFTLLLPRPSIFSFSFCLLAGGRMQAVRAMQVAVLLVLAVASEGQPTHYRLEASYASPGARCGQEAVEKPTCGASSFAPASSASAASRSTWTAP